MKFTASRQALLEAFTITGSITSARAVRPILQHIHVVVRSDGSAELRATELDKVSMRFTVAIEPGAEPGEALMNANRTMQILRECTADDVLISSDDNGKVRIRSGRSNFQVLSESPSEFPELPTFKPDSAFGMDRDKLLLLINKTQFAVAKESSRFAFNGAKLDINGDTARMIASDGKRLAMKSVQIDNSDGVVASPIVPLRALSIFEKVLGQDDDRVRISLDDRQIVLKTLRSEVTSQLVEGLFPNYTAVVPQTVVHDIRFPREELMRAFRQAGLLTTQETKSVRMKLSGGKAVLTAQALDAGEAMIEIDAPDYSAEQEFQISFNPDFFAEGLRAIDADEVRVGLSQPNQQARVTGEEGFVYVIMPVTMRNG